MFDTIGFVSKSRLQKYIGKWDSLYSFPSYRPFSKPEVIHLSPITALNIRFILEKSIGVRKRRGMPEKVNSSGTGSDVIIILT